VTTALLVVDVQRDFCEGGALAVQGGNAVAEKIAAHVKADFDNFEGYSLTVNSMDWHNPPPNTNCGHFALEGEPDYVTSWPVHCVKATHGAGMKDELMGLFDVTVLKGNGCQSYSAFEGVGGVTSSAGVGLSLLAILRSNGITDLDVCGIATDYCVKASVLDARGLGFRVRVLTALCAGVAQATSDAAIKEMALRGATILT
jgi:nicotinamidase/pyrazinamidase